MAEPLNQIQPQTKGKERVFLVKKEFELVIKEQYDKELGLVVTKQVKIDGKEYNDKDLDRVTFDELLKRLARKLKVLEYLNDDNETYEAIEEDIMLDIAKLIYRLHFKYNYWGVGLWWTKKN